jgi:hypothetical protein
MLKKSKALSAVDPDIILYPVPSSRLILPLPGK